MMSLDSLFEAIIMNGEGGTDGRMNERMDGRTIVPLCSTGLRPLRGRCPKAASLSRRILDKLMRQVFINRVFWLYEN